MPWLYKWWKMLLLRRQDINAVPLNYFVFCPISIDFFGQVRLQTSQACYTGQVWYLLYSVWGWDTGHHHSAITLVPGWDWRDIWPFHLVEDIITHSVAMCQLVTSVITFLSFLSYQSIFFSFPQRQSDTCSISFSPFKPQLSTIHLFLSSGPYPSSSTSAAMTECQDWEVSLAKACKLHTLTHSPFQIATQPSFLRIDYPTFQEDNQWAWSAFETRWLRACV